MFRLESYGFELGIVCLECAEVEDNVEGEDYEELAQQLENASPLEIMDKALEKFGNEIAIAFRYVSKFEKVPSFLFVNIFSCQFF